MCLSFPIYKTKANNKFGPSSILYIIKNPIYIGKITWKKKEIKKSPSPYKLKDTRTRDKSEWIIVEGKHSPIIDSNIFNKAQQILNNKYHVPYQIINNPVNPMAGLIICGICNKKMSMRNLRGIYRLLCTNKCGNKSVRFEYVEKSLLDSLEKYTEKYKASIKNNTKKDFDKFYRKHLQSLKKELQGLKKQKLNLFNLLERGIYSDEVFLERSKNIDIRILNTEKEILNLNKQIEKENKFNNEDIIKFENIIKAYKSTTDIKKKNNLLKSILFKIEYVKNSNQKNNDFEIKIFPKLIH